MPKYEYNINGYRVCDHGEYYADDSKEAISKGRRLAIPGSTLRISRIEYNGRRTEIFEREYAPRKSYKKTYKK